MSEEVVKVMKEVEVDVVKPGYKSTEFWLSLVATVVGFVLASGIIEDSSMATQIVGGVAAVLAQLGYTASRAKVKSETF